MVQDYLHIPSCGPRMFNSNLYYIMTNEIITMVTNHVQSQVLMRRGDVGAFTGWLLAGNYNEETEVAETKCRKGESFSFSEFAMAAWEKFNS